jgi:hypothetical protein
MSSEVAALIILVFGIIVATLIFFIVNTKKIGKEVTEEIQATERIGEKTPTTPKEYINVSLGIFSGFKFGFGFTIGSFLAGILITIVLTTFFGITLAAVFSDLFN